jgi:hypothetical protein
MSITYSSKGTPVLSLGSYTFTFTNTDSSKDSWKWIIVAKGGDRDMVPLSLDKLKTKIVPVKTRNKLKKVLSKYNKDGRIHRSDIESLHSDLQTVIGESVSTKIDNILELLR